jgi:steroid 5-alpha reductase family enzyme
MIMLMYIVLAGVSLVIDRRALMVSALIYVIYALNTLMKSFGDIGIHFAITALFIGAMLLLLSAFWHRCRGYVMLIIPQAWQARLPTDQSTTP